jgi:hypothetical protein
MNIAAQNDQRETRRVPARLPIALQWKNGNGTIRRTRGFTRDLSQHGIYCFVEEPIPLKQPVEFDLIFPVQMTASAPLALHCKGTTVRADTKERRIGVAATIESRASVPLSPQDGDSERRTQRRVRPPAFVPVEYMSVSSQIRDVSPTGAFIADERPFPLGRKLTLRFNLNGSSTPIEVHAIVRRVDPQVGMAVEFTELSEEAASQLSQYAA